MTEFQEMSGTDLHDLIARELKHHPLGQHVLDLARAHNIDIRDAGALARIIAEADSTNQEVDVRIVLMLSLFLEKMVQFSEEANDNPLKNQQHTDKSGRHSFSDPTS